MITEENNPELWDRLHQQWEQEGQPVYLAVGTTSVQYSVHQLADGNLAFNPQSAVEDMYNESSLRGMT